MNVEYLLGDATSKELKETRRQISNAIKLQTDLYYCCVCQQMFESKETHHTLVHILTRERETIWGVKIMNADEVIIATQTFLNLPTDISELNEFADQEYRLYLILHGPNGHTECKPKSFEICNLGKSAVVYRKNPGIYVIGRQEHTPNNYNINSNRSIDEHIKTTNPLQTQISKLQMELSVKDSKLDEQRVLIEYLQNTIKLEKENIHRLYDDLETNKYKLENAYRTKDKLITELEALKNKLDIAKAAYIRHEIAFRDEIASIKIEIQDLTTKLNFKIQELERVTGINLGMELKSKEKEREFFEALNEVARAKRDLSNANVTIGLLTNEMIDKELSFQKANDTQKDLQILYDNQKIVLETKENELEIEKEKIISLDKSIREMQNRLDTQARTITSLSQILESKEKNLSDLSEEKLSLLETRERLAEYINGLSSKLEERELKLALIQGNITESESLKREISVVKSELNISKEHIFEVKQKLQEAELTIKGLLDAKATIIENLKEASILNASLRRQIDQQRYEINDSEKKITDHISVITTEQAKLKEENIQIRETMKDAWMRLDAAEEEKNKTHELIEEQKKKNMLLETTLKQQQLGLQRNRQRTMNITARYTKTKREMKLLGIEMNNMKTTIEALHIEKDELLTKMQILSKQQDTAGEKELGLIKEMETLEEQNTKLETNMQKANETLKGMKEQQKQLQTKLDLEAYRFVEALKETKRANSTISEMKNEHEKHLKLLVVQKMELDKAIEELNIKEAESIMIRGKYNEQTNILNTKEQELNKIHGKLKVEQKKISQLLEAITKQEQLIKTLSKEDVEEIDKKYDEEDDIKTSIGTEDTFNNNKITFDDILSTIQTDEAYTKSKQYILGKMIKLEQLFKRVNTNRSIFIHRTGVRKEKRDKNREIGDIDGDAGTKKLKRQDE